MSLRQGVLLVSCIASLGTGALGCQSEWVLSRLAAKEDTEYASGYSEKAFDQVRIGMTFDEVRALAGAPLEEYSIEESPEAVGWRYTRSPNSQSYRIRALVFIDGRVKEIYSEFYLD